MSSKEMIKEEDIKLDGLQTADVVTIEPVMVPSNHHKLQSQYWIWFSKRWNAKLAKENFDETLKHIGTFGSVEQFWAIYSHLTRPSQLPVLCDIHIFKLGIKPMWEDPANSKGGRWVVRLRKGLASRCWENLVLATIGEQFMVGDELCGVVVSTRTKDDHITVWNKNASDPNTVARIRDTMRRIMNLPPNTALEYKEHASGSAEKP